MILLAIRTEHTPPRTLSRLITTVLCCCTFLSLTLPQHVAAAALPQVNLPIQEDGEECESVVVATASANRAARRPAVDNGPKRNRSFARAAGRVQIRRGPTVVGHRLANGHLAPLRH